MRRIWERVVEKLRAGSMPPPGRPRPDAATYLAAATELESALDRAWAAHPDPGRIGAVHRLNRTEYTNAIRDLFGLDSQSLDVVSQLPGDETADGSFDNFADVLSISTAHLERYMSVARQVTRLATALPPSHPAVETFEIPLHVTQDDRQSEDLPLGSRGGIAVRYHFPVDGEYRIKVRLQRNYQDYLKGMGWEQLLDVRLDGKLLKRFAVGGKAQGRPAGASYAGDGEPGFAGAPEWERYMQLDGDAGLEVRVPVTAGSRVVGVSFVRQLWEPEGLPQPLQRGRVITNDEVYMGYANVGAVQIGGPYTVGARTELEEERELEPDPRVHLPAAGASERRACATKIMSRLARLAYRRPVDEADVQTLMRFYEEGRREGGTFEAGVQFALERMLVDPDFLLRVYRDPRARQLAAAAQPRLSAYRDLELASRLSFFLWSQHSRRSAADAGRAAQAERSGGARAAGEAHAGGSARDRSAGRRLRRAVAEPAARRRGRRRSGALSELRPHADGVVQARDRAVCRQHAARGSQRARAAERRLHVRQREARAALRHSRHLRQPFPPRDAADTNQRGGLLAQGALLSTTSYPDRTSPVLRGKFLLNNIFGLQIDAAAGRRRHESRAGEAGRRAARRFASAWPSIAPTRRARAAIGHRSARALRSRTSTSSADGGRRRGGQAGRCAGTTMSGANVEGLSGLRALLLERREQFPRTVTEKLLAYALGRSVEHYDRPAVRQIVRDAAAAGLPLVVVDPGNRQESGISDARRRQPHVASADAEPIMRACSDIEGSSTADGSARAGRHAGAAVSRCDDAGDGRSRRSARRKPAHRFLAFYVPNGMAMEYWSPKAEGSAFELTPILQPLEPFRNQMLVLSGIHANWVAIHAGASGAFLTGTPRGGKTEIEIFADTSMDQLLARHYASETQIASLEMAMDPPANAGACTGNLSCVYTHTLSWRSPTQPLPMEWNPRAVFEKLFGDSGQHRSRGARGADAAAQEHARLGQREAGILRAELGPQDRVKVEQYTEAVRDVERRIQRAEQQSRSRAAGMDQPQGAPPVFEDHLALMLDLQLLAFQTDLTRVISFMLGKEQSARPYPQIGVPEAHHPLSHHQDNAGAHRAHVEDQPVSRRAVLEVSREAARHAGRRRHAARSHDDSLRLRHLEQHAALGREPAAARHGRRRGQAEGRPAS